LANPTTSIAEGAGYIIQKSSTYEATGANRYVPKTQEAWTLVRPESAPEVGTTIKGKERLQMASKIMIEVAGPTSMTTTYEIFYAEMTINKSATDDSKRTYVLDYAISGNTYVFSFPMIAAKEFGSEVEFTIYGIKADGTIESRTIKTSIQKFCMDNITVNETTSDKFYAAILNYGAANQVYFKYNTDKLANAVFTEDYAKYYKDIDSDFEVTATATQERYTGGVLAGHVATLDTSGEVFLGAKMRIANGTDLTGLYLEATYTGIDDGGSYTVRVDSVDWINRGAAGSGYTFYEALIGGIAAKNLRSDVTYRLYRDNGTAKPTLESNDPAVKFSVESFAAVEINGANAKLAYLCKAILAYADAAAAYFNN